MSRVSDGRGWWRCVRVAGVQDTWWEVLPEQARQLPAELATIDAYLDDERFVAPWRAVFAERLRRPSVPVETLLRLLCLKHRYQRRGGHRRGQVRLSHPRGVRPDPVPSAAADHGRRPLHQGQRLQQQRHRIRPLVGRHRQNQANSHRRNQGEDLSNTSPGAAPVGRGRGGQLHPPVRYGHPYTVPTATSLGTRRWASTSESGVPPRRLRGSSRTRKHRQGSRSSGTPPVPESRG